MTLYEIDKRITQCQEELARLTAERKRVRIANASDDNARMLRAVKAILKANLPENDYKKIMSMAEELSHDYTL